MLVEVLRAIQQELASLREDNAAMREQMRALPLSSDEADYLADLKKRNAYLEGELKRRDGLEQPQVRRPWWRVWGTKL